MKFILLILPIYLIFAQDVYYPHIDVQKANDSIINIIDKSSEMRISFKEGFFRKNHDATDQPNLYNSTFHFYTDSAGNRYAYLVNPFIIKHYENLSLETIRYFSLFKDQLINLKLKEPSSSITHCREFLLELKSKNDTNSLYVKLDHFVFDYIGMFPRHKKRDLDKSSDYDDDYIYMVNSKIYLFYYLIQDDIDYMISLIENSRDQEDFYKKLGDKEKIEWNINWHKKMIKQNQMRLDELQEELEYYR